MQRVMRYHGEAERAADLARKQFGDVAKAHRAIESAYRVLALSVRTELWWPPRPGARETLGAAEVQANPRGANRRSAASPAAAASAWNSRRPPGA